MFLNLILIHLQLIKCVLAKQNCYRVSQTEGVVSEPEPPKSPCSPNPCGANTDHKVVGNNCICTCLPGYQGDATRGCRPECVISSECGRDQACINLKCVDPCSPGLCARNADCVVTNHVPQCKCKTGFTGNPFEECVPEQPSKISSLSYSRIFSPTFQIFISRPSGSTHLDKAVVFVVFISIALFH